MHLTIDFETRSPVDLKKAGVWKYAQSPYTEVMCMAIKVDHEPTCLWVPYNMECYITDEFKDILLPKDTVQKLIDHATTIEAHNMEFERVIWKYVMTGLGFKDLEFNKLRCSAAKAAILGLPRSLEKLCIALNLKQQKDMAGSRVMKKLTAPKKPTKAELRQLQTDGWTQDGDLWVNDNGDKACFWHSKPEEYHHLFRYCIQDVEAEHEASQALPEITLELLKLWRVDAIINERGVTIDKAGAHAMIQMCEEYKHRLNLKLRYLTCGAVDKGSEVAKISAWLSAQGVFTHSLDAEAVDNLLDDPSLPPDCREVLNCRQEFSKSSVAKYDAMIERVQADGKIRSMFLFHGAHTGRFAGRGVQLQNLPSRGILKDPELALESVKNGACLEFISLLWESPLKVASSCIRSCIKASEGKEFICADYSAIEGRVLAWLAGEDPILDGYREGLDMYKVAASGAYGIKYEAVNKSQRQVGKVIELACGYQGWIGAFHAMAKGYGLVLPDDEIKTSILAWRDNRPMTVRLWAEIQAAAVMAIQNPDKMSQYRQIKFRMCGPHLQCRLPSGRILWYPFVETRRGVNQWDKPVDRIFYWTEDSVTKQWVKKETYGGKLVENIVQGISLDITAGALIRMEESGWHPVMHIHDECVAEEDIGAKTVEELCKVMCELPKWAEGLPVEADGWKGPRYKKDG